MRVALSASVIQGGRSGIATYVFGLLEGLRRIGSPDRIVILGLENDRPHFERWLDVCEWHPVPEAFRPAVRNVFWHQTHLRGVLRAAKIDVLHVPSYRRIVARPPCPQVVTVHDLAAFAVKGKYDTARMLYGRYVVRALARQATIVSTVSHATAADIEKYFGLPLEHVPVIWNGIDHDLCRPPAPADLQAALTRLQQLKPYFIYLARLEHPGKNHVRLIEAFEQFCHDCPAQPHELLLGGADWHGAEVIHQRIADSPVRNRIRALGFVDKADLPIWYAGATAMVYPSLFEGFGLPLAEAMACGCPVISSDRGSLGEVAGGAARLVDAESVPSITAALREFVENPEAAQTWRAHGLARAQEFKWEKAATAMTHLYKQAAGGLA